MMEFFFATECPKSRLGMDSALANVKGRPTRGEEANELFRSGSDNAHNSQHRTTTIASIWFHGPQHRMAQQATTTAMERLSTRRKRATDRDEDEENCPSSATLPNVIF
jgi:hypothetical protein